MGRKVKNNSDEIEKTKETPIKETVKKESTKKEANKKNNIDEEMFNKKQIKGKTYIAYHTRIIISLLVFAILLSLSFILIMMSFSKINEQTVDYKESSDISYKVYLNDNSFWHEEYLESGNNNIFISPLIKKINTKFDYNFDISEKTNVEFTYYVVGTLKILDGNESKEFYSEEYRLTSDKQQKIYNDNKAFISEEIDIDYAYYNELANKFRQNYGLNTKSYFEVSFIVKGINKKGDFNLDLNYTRSVKIPLAEREVDIKVDDNKVSNIHKSISKDKLLINNRLYIIIGSFALIVAIICFVKIVKNIMIIFVPKKSKYDKYIKRLLREYDRLIVNTLSAPDLNNMRIVKLENFTELLDVRDNLKLPIKYYVVTEHQKCVFYVTHNNEIYVLTIKAVDLEK